MTKRDELIALADLRRANVTRQKEWDAFDQLTLAYRGNELAGEVGEACNVIKKLERERLGIAGSRDTVAHLAEELADVIICTDLIAMQAGIDLSSAVIAKFNASSEKVGLKTRLYTAPSAVAPGPSDPSSTRREVTVESGIYIASKTKHADRWKRLRSEGVPIISTWIDEAGAGETSDFHDLWRRCLTESANCRVLVSYREPGEVLKGGWVEIGAALAKGVPVYAVGLEEFTIAGYRGITHFPTIEDAIAAAIRSQEAGR